MEKKIKAVNKKTGVASEFTEKQWKKVSESEIFKASFKKVEEAKVPKEVKSIEKAKKVAKTKEKDVKED